MRRCAAQRFCATAPPIPGSSRHGGHARATSRGLVQARPALFIRRWVPELAKVPLPYLAEPWTMDSSVQQLAGCQIAVDYPAPIVDEKLAMKAAKDHMYGLRNTDQARAEAGKLQAKHGSRKRGLPNTTTPRRPKPAAAAMPSPQIDLFS